MLHHLRYFFIIIEKVHTHTHNRHHHTTNKQTPKSNHIKSYFLFCGFLFRFVSLLCYSLINKLPATVCYGAHCPWLWFYRSGCNVRKAINQIDNDSPKSEEEEEKKHEKEYALSSYYHSFVRLNASIWKVFSFHWMQFLLIYLWIITVGTHGPNLQYNILFIVVGSRQLVLNFSESFLVRIIMKLMEIIRAIRLSFIGLPFAQTHYNSVHASGCWTARRHIVTNWILVNAWNSNPFKLVMMV